MLARPLGPMHFSKPIDRTEWEHKCLSMRMIACKARKRLNMTAMGQRDVLVAMARQLTSKTRVRCSVVVDGRAIGGLRLATGI